jgi:hypothetical protein
MQILHALTDAEKQSVNIRILGGVLGMIIHFFLLLSFPNQIMFFEGGLFICGGFVLHGIAKYLQDAEVRSQTSQGEDSTTELRTEGTRGTISRFLLLVTGLAYGAGLIAWLVAVLHLIGFP